MCKTANHMLKWSKVKRWQFRLSNKNFLVIKCQLIGQRFGFVLILHFKLGFEFVTFAYFIRFLALTTAAHSTTHDAGQHNKHQADQNGNTSTEGQFMESWAKSFAVMFLKNNKQTISIKDWYNIKNKWSFINMEHHGYYMNMIIHNDTRWL